jgi:two-component system LytT family response regulator
MRRIRTLIVDDEPLARDGIAVLLGGDAETEVIGACADGKAAIEEIREKRPDLVFLDVQMPRLNGFEALESLPEGSRPEVIFVTAYDKYAIRAFEVSAVDYLLKPFGNERFLGALRRAKERIRRAGYDEAHRSVVALLEHLRGPDGADAPSAGEPGPDRSGRLSFRIGGGVLFLAPESIAWIEAQGDAIKVCADGQAHAVRESLNGVEERLEGGTFLRVHRSFLVNTDRIMKVTSALYGDYVLQMDDGAKIPLSRSYRDRFKAVVQPRLA